MNERKPTKKTSSKFAKLLVLGAIMMSVTGCGANIPVTNFCDLYNPVYTSRNDTAETIKQVVDNNLVWDEFCQ